jgi:hypothetical protein
VSWYKFSSSKDELQVTHDSPESKANLDCCKITPQEPFGTSSDSALGCFQDFLGSQNKPVSVVMVMVVKYMNTTNSSS